MNPAGGAGDRATPGGAAGGRRRVDLLPYALIAPITVLLNYQDKIAPYWQQALRQEISVKDFHAQAAKFLRGEA